jgi:hypothetical protein
MHRLVYLLGVYAILLSNTRDYYSSKIGILAYEIPIMKINFQGLVFLKDLLKTQGINLTTEKALSGHWVKWSLILTSIKISLVSEMWAGRLAWLGRWLYEPKVAGSSPARPTTFPQSELDVLRSC